MIDFHIRVVSNGWILNSPRLQGRSDRTGEYREIGRSETIYAYNFKEDKERVWQMMCDTIKFLQHFESERPITIVR